MEEVQMFTQASDQALRAAQTAKMEEESAAAIEAGLAYLAENAQKEGVTVTESGLQYEVIEAGEGASPQATDTVTVHYKGTLIDGTEFDSSYGRGEPTSFPLNRVISGWTEGLQLMQEGAKYRFVIPSELAYGARGQGAITPNSTLIFEVELLEVAGAEATATE
jgi:FKBP-type peptidyl-prolyl cis-trans isomerase FkpA